MTRIFLGIFFFFFCNLVPLKEIKFKKKKEKWGGGGEGYPTCMHCFQSVVHFVINGGGVSVMLICS